MSEHFDALETRDPELRERELLARLPAQIAHAKRMTAAYAGLLAGVDPAAITSRSALASLPVTRKSTLLELQQASRPFGGFSAVGWGESLRVFASPGPIYQPETGQTDYWRLARALYAAGFRKGELIHNCFSYHFSPAGSMLETAAHALGCTVFPGGVGQTEQQVQAMLDLKPQGYVGTPSFLKLILEKADQLGVKITSLSKALVSGEAFPTDLYEWLRARGVQGLQVYATADVGAIAYQSSARQGLIVDEGILLEIVRPGTDDPVAVDEVGEVVVTTFNPAYPLLRFGTGDLSAFLPGISPCGRTNLRIKGWLGRADQATKVRGLFVHPSQVAEILKRHPEIRKVRLLIDNPQGEDHMSLHCEVVNSSSSLADAIVLSIRELTKLRGEVLFKSIGELPNDGKLIDDLRKYS